MLNLPHKGIARTCSARFGHYLASSAWTRRTRNSSTPKSPNRSVATSSRWGESHTLEVNCVNAGVFSPEELEARIAEIAEGAPLPVRDDPRLKQALEELVEQGASNARPVPREPRFRTGDRVRGRVFPDARHVRIPGYAQGKVGTVQVVHEAFVFPDTNLRDEGENPEHVYAVGFRARDLWPDADEDATVLVDLWESYLEEAA